MPAMIPPSPSTPSPTKSRRGSSVGMYIGRKGTLTLTIRGARNLKAPTPELLGGRSLPRPLRDCVLVASPGGAAPEPASWESHSKPALFVSHIWDEEMVFTGVNCPTAHDRGKKQVGAPPLRLHLLYRDVSGQPVARWEALPIDPDTWRAAAASTQERWLPLYTTAKVSPSPSPSPTKSRSPTPVGPAMRRGSIGGSSTSGRASGGSPSKQQQQQQKHAYVGDLLVAVRLVPDRPAPRLRYRRPFRVAGGVLQLPSQLLLPQWLRASLVGSIGWYVDGLLAAFAALRLLPRRRGPAGGLKGSSGQLEGEDGVDDEEMAGVPRLNLFQKLFYLSALFVALASVSMGASLALLVAASLFPVVTFLVAGSLLAVVGLGLPALVVVGIVFSAPPVRRGLLEPAILRFQWTRALFLEDAAGEEEAGPGEIGVEEQQEPAGTPVAEKPAA